MDSFADILLLAGVVFHAPLVVLGPLLLWQTLRSHALRCELAQRGYDWLTFNAALVLNRELGAAARLLPHRDHLGVLPEFRDDVDALIRIGRLKNKCHHLDSSSGA